MRSSRTQPPARACVEHRYSLAQRVIAALLLMVVEVAPIQVGVQNVLALGLARSAHAAPVADLTAAPRFQPGIGQTTGGAPLPVVNITAPNAAGASLNRYRQFNVDANGLVINNSGTGGGTLLGGQVGANPLLRGRAASVIINEVGSGFASSTINGAIEVFGPRADLVIANPNGITCNGCGFVNTPRVTLATGALRFLDAPNGSATAFDSAAAWGYDVRGGAIRIGAPGGQAGIEGTVGQIDLIAQTIALHAPLRAGAAANLITGRQWVAFDAAGNAVVAANGDNGGAGYAIDATELGAVSAGRITIIATAAGPGVRVDSRLGASAGDLLISANGDVSIARAYASGDLRAKAQGTMTLQGDAQAAGELALHAGGALDAAVLGAHAIRLDAGGAITSGGLQSDTTIRASAGGGLSSHGAIAAAGAVTITAERDIAIGADVHSGATLDLASRSGSVTIAGNAAANGRVLIAAGRDIRVATGSLSSKADLTALAGRDMRVDGSVTAGQGLRIDAATGSLTVADELFAGADLNAHAGVDLILAGKGKVGVGTAAVLNAGGSVIVGGVADFGRSLDVQAGGLAQFKQALTVAERLGVDASSLSLRGDVVAGDDVVAHIAGDATLDGRLTALANLNLDARGTATLNGAAIVAGDAVVTTGSDLGIAGNLLAGGNARLAAKGLVSQTAGLIGAAGMLAVSGAQGVSGSGVLAAGRSVTVDSSAGAVATGFASAGGDLVIDAARNSESATLQAAGNIRQTAGNDIVNRGMVFAGGTLNQKANGGIAQAGASVGTGITAAAGGDIHYNDTLVAGTLELKSKQQLTLAGRVDAGDVMLEAAGRLRTTAGVHAIRGTLNATAAGMHLDADATSAGNAVYTALAGDVEGAGVLQSGGDLTLKAGGRIERGKLVAAVGRLAVSGRQGVTLGDTIAVSGGDIDSAGGDVRLSGVTGSGGGLTVVAAGALSVDKAVTARGSVSLGAGGNVDINGALTTLGNLRIDAGRMLALNADVAANGLTTLTGGEIDNRAKLSSGSDLFMQARKRLASGVFGAGGNARLRGDSVTMSASTVLGELDVAGGDIALTQKTLVRGSSALNGRSVLNQGELISGRQLTINAGTVTNTTGSQFLAFGDTTIVADNIFNAGGIFGDRVSLDSSKAVDNSGGLVLGNASVALRAGSLRKNRDGRILSAGTLLLDIDEPLENSGGRIHADGDMTLQLHGATFDPGAAANGLLTLGGKLTIIANDFRNTAGWTVPGTALDLQIQQSFINRGLIEKAGDLRIATPAAIENSGQMVAGGTLTLDGAAIVNSGLLHANGDMKLVAAADIVNSGRIHAQGALALQGAALDNRNTNRDDGVPAGISAAGDMQLALRRQVDNTAGSIAAIGDIVIAAPEVHNDRGPPTGTLENGRNYSKEVLDGMIVETNRTTLVDVGGEGGGQAAVPIPDRTLGSYRPDYASRTVASPATAWGRDPGGDTGPVKEPVGDISALPGVDVATTTQREGRAGVIASGRNLRVEAPALLNNRGGAIAANGNVTLNLGRLDNGRSATLTNGTVETIDPADHARFIADMNKPYYYYDPARSWVTESLLAWELHPRTVDKRYRTPGQRGAIVAGKDFILNGPSLVNTGNITVGGNAAISAGASFINQGDYARSLTTQAGCVSGTRSCHDNNGAPGVDTFAYRTDPNALIVGGSLFIDAPVIGNAHATMAARGRVSLTADQVVNVAGVVQSTAADLVIKAREVVNRVEAPVTVHESWGDRNPPEAPGCNPGNQYKDSHCSLGRDVAASPAPVFAAARDISIGGDRLDNIGGLISAGRKVDIDMRNAASNTAQALAINWKGYWVEETGLNHDDIPHRTDGIVALPPQHAAIQAPTVAVRVGGLLQNTGNISGQDVDLRGAHLINGITAPNQPSPPPTGMKQVTVLTQDSPVAAPLAALAARTDQGQGQAKIETVVDKVLKLFPGNGGQPALATMLPALEPGNTKRKESTAAAQAAGAAATTAQTTQSTPLQTDSVALVDPARSASAPAARVHYLDTSAARGAEVLGTIGPQQLLDRLPAELRGATPLPFAFDPFVENQLLQRQALESTGRAYYVNGLSFDDRNTASLDDQQKVLFYTNALAYAQTQRLSIGQPLSEAQVAALDRPMLWYVEQQVPDAACRDIGALSQANCPTLAALVPVLYLDRASAERLSTQSLGLIAGAKVVADFSSRIDNSGIISGADVGITTPELKNAAREIDIGRATYKVDGGWSEVTGTRIEPGGFISAQRLAGAIDRLESVGGTLQVLGADGSVDVAQTEALFGKLGSVLGVESYSHIDLKDDIHVHFIKDSSNAFERVVAMVAAVALSFIVGPAISAYLGEGAAAGSAMAAGSAATATTAAVGAGVGNLVVSGFITGTMASMTAQFVATGEVDAGSALKSGLTGSLTAGLSEAAGLNQMAGIRDMGDGLLQGTFNGTQAGQALLGVGGRALISATVGTGINGGSFGQAMLNSVAADAAALGANLIGQTMDGSTAWNSEGGLAHVLSHAALGCAVAGISGKDCAGAAIGAATSAALLPLVGDALGLTAQDKASPNVQAGMTTLSMLAGGFVAASTGHDPTSAAGAAQNEALNNYLTPKERATLAQAGSDCAAAGGNADSAACMQRDSLMRLDAQRNAGLAQGEYSPSQAREWQGQEYQTAATCPPPYQCAANVNAAGLEGYWQAKAVGEQALLAGYDPVDVALGLSGIYGVGRGLVGLGAGEVRGLLPTGAKGASEIENAVLGRVRTGSATKTDPVHSFPDMLDNYVGNAAKFSIPTKGPGGVVIRESNLYQVEGGLNSKQGIFEWIVDQGQVTHRRFIPNGQVTGFPNQISPKP